MIAVAVPILLASLAGGLHCVGMCGPFGAAACGAKRGSAAAIAQLPYHFGRLVTYVGLGAAAGLVGRAIDWAGAIGGFSHLSALVAGVVMILFAVAALLPRRGLVTLGRGPAPAQGRLSTLLVAISRRAPRERAFLLGLATTLIPCGWLYGFVASAAGTGAVLPAVAVMFAFWLGTLPWLLGASLGLRALVPRFGARVRAASAGMIAVAGVLLIFMRTSSTSMAAPAPEQGAAPTAGMPADCPFHGH